MPRVRIYDRSRNGLNMVEVDGRLFPGDVDEKIIRAVPDIEMRDDDVIICGWMRSGTHWTFEIANMLLRGAAETVDMPKQDQMLERMSVEQQKALKSPRVLNTHLLYKDLPVAARQKKTKIIFLVRDPRDCAVSWFNFHQKLEYFGYMGKWEDWLPLFLEGKLDWGSWFDFLRDWEQAMLDNPDIPIHVIHYEENKANPVDTVQKLSRFLGVNASEELCQKIADKCSFHRMREDKQKYAWKSKNGIHVHYRKGIVGDWKQWFSEDQRLEFDKVYEEKMAGSRFKHFWSPSSF